MRSRVQTILMLPLLFAAACVEPYYPPSENGSTVGYLVVDGFLDGVKGTGTVKLTRSVILTDYRPSAPELDAVVTVEDENGGSFSLKEGLNGYYTADLNFDPASNYRLHVKTQDGSSYTSDYIQLKQSPAFDSLVWRAEDRGIRFYVNSHDDLGKTRYYRYRYEETWEYRVAFVSHYKSVGGQPVPRKENEMVTYCWDSRTSAPVLIKSTTNLTKDIVSMFPINFVDKGSRKLAITYSFLVEQRAISEDEYHFWDLIHKTNESLGGLFDPIPSQVFGNMHNDGDPNNPVLGYFSGGYTKQKRVFINFEDLPKDLQTLDPLSYTCGISDYTVNGDQELGSQIFVEVHVPYTNLWFVTSANCGDCTSLGGATTKPNFWPQ